MLLGELNYRTFTMLLVGVLVCLPLGLYSSPVRAQALESLPSVKNCSLVSDQQLAELRGSYDGYYFSVDIGISMARHDPQVSVQYTAQVPSGSPAPALNGGVASFNNGTVSFQAGAGTGTQGPGFYQVLSVAGNNQMVITNTNFTITLPEDLESDLQARCYTKFYKCLSQVRSRTMKINKGWRSPAGCLAALLLACWFLPGLGPERALSPGVGVCQAEEPAIVLQMIRLRSGEGTLQGLSRH